MIVASSCAVLVVKGETCGAVYMRIAAMPFAQDGLEAVAAKCTRAATVELSAGDNSEMIGVAARQAPSHRSTTAAVKQILRQMAFIDALRRTDALSFN